MRVELLAISAWMALNIGIALVAMLHSHWRGRRLRLRCSAMIDAAEAWANHRPTTSSRGAVPPVAPKRGSSYPPVASG